MGMRDASRQDAGHAGAFDPKDGAQAGDAIRFTAVEKSYNGRRVLRSVTFTLENGGAYCLMGPSGMGKTTLLRVLLGLERADSGSIDGIRPGQIAAMFQEDRLCDTLTPVENVALVLPPSTRRSEVRVMLEEILPPYCMEQPVAQLSGGMRRRVSLARAMAFPSRMVVMDEPFTGLDKATRVQVIEFVKRHARDRTLLVATHGEDDAALLGASKVLLTEVSDKC